MVMDKQLERLTDDIVRCCSPRRIVLYNHKTSPGGELTSVKLGVIIADGDADAVEQSLYLRLECDLPFDVLVYTQDEWRTLTADETSFAAHIQRSGRVLYEYE